MGEPEHICHLLNVPPDVKDDLDNKGHNYILNTRTEYKKRERRKTGPKMRGWMVSSPRMREREGKQLAALGGPEGAANVN